MTKDYKRKGYLELNSSDAPKLSKAYKKPLKSSYRIKEKQSIKKELETLPPSKHDIKEMLWDLEVEMASLCYLTERELGCKCTCPLLNNESDVDKARDHINYLNKMLLKRGDNV